MQSHSLSHCKATTWYQLDAASHMCSISFARDAEHWIQLTIICTCNTILVGGFKHFYTFFIFHNIWDCPSHWLIFFKMVKTTTRYVCVCVRVERDWPRWFCRRIFAAWLLAMDLIRAWIRFHGRKNSNTWPLVTDSTRAWSMWRCLPSFKVWRSATSSVGAFRGFTCLRLCKTWPSVGGRKLLACFLGGGAPWRAWTYERQSHFSAIGVLPSGKLT